MNFTSQVPRGSKASTLIYLTHEQRTWFFVIYIILLLVAVGGNSAAIIITIQRKHRYLQKCCIISLAISDLFTAIIYCINNVETFSHPMINWTLGSFLCSFIPMAQMFGITASTCAMVVIALDRYRNIVHALTNRWNPDKIYCFLGFCVLWIACAGISYPAYTMFTLRHSYVFYDIPELSDKQYEILYFCATGVKDKLMIYYICLAVLVFATLFLIFLCLYYNIAKLVWKHRKPRCFPDRREVSTVIETSTTQVKSSEEMNTNHRKLLLTTTKNIRVERKIRTFKIIIFLMLTFLVCRMPFWIYNIIKLVQISTENKFWVMTYVFNAFALFNCAINPFLYTFLNLTMKCLISVRNGILEFVGKICCCCCTNADFEDFERGNPFDIRNFKGSNVQVASINKINIVDPGAKYNQNLCMDYYDSVNKY